MNNKEISINDHEFANWLNFNYFYLFLFISAISYSLPGPLSAQQSTNQSAKTINKINPQGKNWAEKLGYPQGKKVLLLHMDDAGMSPEANAAVERYITINQIMSTAVMMPCPAAKDFVTWAKSHPKADVCFHLTLTIYLFS